MYATEKICFCFLVVLIAVCEVEPQTCAAMSYDRDIKIVCNNITGKFPHITYIYSACTNCNVPVIDKDIIPVNVGNNFNLSYSHVRVIKEDAFIQLKLGVRSFTLNNNEISTIPKNLFMGCLKEINFRANNFSKLDDNLFAYVTINVLDFSHNQITQFGNAFNETTITDLNLSYNEIREISEDSFKNTRFTKEYYKKPRSSIYLAHNYIASLPEHAFETGTKFDTFDLNNNRLTEIKNNMFKGYNVHVLDLSSNSITILNRHSFADISDLQILSLNNNKIETIPPFAFFGLKQLRYLNLNENRITQITHALFSGLEFLQYLNISNNQIEVLGENNLIPLAQLESLDLSGNRLQLLQLGEILEHNSKLHYMYVNRNLWQCEYLIGIYKMLVKKNVTFETTGRDYNVPNLHGIPCSRQKININRDDTFDKFLGAISHDMVLNDLYNVKIEPVYTEEERLANYLMKTYYLFIFIIALIVLYCLVRWTAVCVQKLNLFRNSKLNKADV